MMRYAEVTVNTAVQSTFHYHIPDSLRNQITYGHLVRVAFGTAMQPAIVVDLHEQLPPELANIQTKPIIELLDPLPVMTEDHIELALWMSATYLTPPGACLWLALPPGLVGKSIRMVHLIDSEAEGATESQQVILEILRERGPLRLSELKKAVPYKTAAQMLRAMAKQGIVRVESQLALPAASAKMIQTVMRSMPEEEVVDTLARLKRAPKQSRVFAYIAKHDYPVDVPDVYTATDATSADLNNLERKGLIQRGERLAYRDSLADRDFVPSQAPPLTPEQRQVWERIRPHLLSSTRPEAGARDESLSVTLWDEQSMNPLPNSGEVAAKDSRKEADVNYRQWSVSADLWQKLKPHAREMRKKPTIAEDRLWQRLRKKKRSGFKFRRQYAIASFIVGFYCAAARLVIEVDGPPHTQQDEYDKLRDAYLQHLGLHVLHFSNDAVMRDVDGVLQTIREALHAIVSDRPESKQKGFLLHGVTGSGKTEIYLHAIAATLKQGRQALFLVPEIALTPQTIRRVAQRFPGQVAVVHSGLSKGERHDTWQRTRQGEIGVIVGTRSALFTPLPDLGLIILDEAHDTSYKQTPPIDPPYYHARDVAEYMAKLNQAVMILGSATPDVETFYRAQQDELSYLHLPNRIMGHRKRVEKQAKRRGIALAYSAADGEAMTIALPPVRIVDMRAELKAGNRSMFSRDLNWALFGVLERGEQAMLLLNRRGQSTYVFCRDCGYVVGCDNCDTSMTYHRHGEAMRCHHCGTQQAAPTICPQCGSQRIRYFGAGTQQVEAEVRKLYPGVSVLRWDADTVHKSDLHEIILSRFVNGDAQVMVGTQMIAKGLDLPLVTLVGVVSADPGLALPDFRADERAFQLLTQVAGRAGRGLLGGQVIIQTYQPQHPSITAASHHDYAQFYAQEIANRRELGYPPFRRLARILVRHTHPIEAQREVEKAEAYLRHQIESQNLTDTQLIGPAPCFFSRIDRHYRWQILIRSSNPHAALRAIQIRPGWYVDIDPVDVL